MSNNNQRRIRREQIERWLASEDMSIDEWCKRNHIGRSTFYRWLAIFRKEEPEIFGTSKHDGWIEIARQNHKDAMSLAVVDKNTGVPAPPSMRYESQSSCTNMPITVAVNGATISIPSGSNATDITNVMKAVMG